MAREYWGRDDDLPNELVEDLLTDDQDGKHSEDLTDRLARVIEPEMWDPRNGWVQIGDQYATALWLAEYPTETASADVSLQDGPVQPRRCGRHEPGPGVLTRRFGSCVANAVISCLRLGEIERQSIEPLRNRETPKSRDTSTECRPRIEHRP